MGDGRGRGRCWQDWFVPPQRSTPEQSVSTYCFRKQKMPQPTTISEKLFEKLATLFWRRNWAVRRSGSGQIPCPSFLPTAPESDTFRRWKTPTASAAAYRCEN